MSEYIISDEQIAENRRLNGRMLLVMPVVVRCRDCAYMFDWAYDRPLCKLWAFNDPDESESGNGNALYPNVKPDGYCAWGERRNDEG